MPPMKLVICEKPQVAKTMAYALSPHPRPMKHGSVTYYIIEEQNDHIAIAPAVGHIFTLREKTHSFNYPVFDIEWVPAYTDKTYAYTKPYVETFRSLAQRATEVINACDYDIEGSLIGYNVMRFLCKKGTWTRMHYSTLTDEELRDAYARRSSLDTLNALAGETRHILDWYYGINWSRALMHALRTTNTHRTLSIGRVQGPTLKIIVEREREISRFVPETFFVLLAHYGSLVLRGEKKYPTREDATRAIVKTGVVSAYEKREQTIYPPPPFDLTTLQLEAYRHLHISPSRTLDLAQELYENRYISYPRTSSQKIPPSINVATILYKLAPHEPLAQKLIDEKRFKPRQGKQDDPAHPAIYPTGIVGPMNPDAARLYRMIVRRFLGCFAENAKILVQKVAIVAGENTYRADAERIVQRGWMEYYDYVSIEENDLPSFSVGASITFDTVDVREETTKPPARYSQASIIKALEDKNLGTKATRALIIDTLYKRGYIVGKTIRATTLGVAVCEALEQYCPEILDEALTRSFEEKMQRIATGEVQQDVVLAEGKEVLTSALRKFKEKEAEAGARLASSLSIGSCPACGKDLRIVPYKGKQFVGCSGYPNCKTAYPIPSRSSIIGTGKLCPICRAPIVLLVQGKRKYETCINVQCPSKEKTQKKSATASKKKGSAKRKSKTQKKQ